MNVGDLMMRWSNGKSSRYSLYLDLQGLAVLNVRLVDTLKSTVHRVTLPPKQDRFTGDERLTRARYSIPYFVVPKGETMVGCLPTCTNQDRPPKYDPIKWNDYMLMRASMQY